MLKRFLSIASITVFIAGFIALMSHQAFAAATVTSVKMTGPNTITITYSQPVYSTIGDYLNFSGSFNGYGVVSLSGTGTNTIVLVLNNSAPNNASGSLTIGTGVTDVSDGQSFGGGTWTIVPLTVVPPAIISFSMSSNLNDSTFAGTNDTISITFQTNEAVNLQSVTVAGHPVSTIGNGSGPYTLNYTIQGSDVQQSVPVVITFSDIYGNQSHVSFSFIGTTTGTSGSALITSITSNANTSGVLTVGNSITFILTPVVPEPNAQITGYYNSVPLSWTTNNGGINYMATYTVAVGQVNQSYPLQITGVTLTDQYGNTSAPASGYDVQKIINTQSQGPTLSQVTTVPSTFTGSTPTYTFYSTGSGSMAYGGTCTSPVATAVAGLNTITFNPLANGTYSNCTLTVIGSTGVAGNTLTIPSFMIIGSSATSASNATIDSLTTQLQTLQQQLSQLQSQQNSTTVSSYKFNNPLNVGSTGTDVTELQKRLTAEGVYSGPITGYYGSLTQAAVEKYQTLHGLSPLGNVGPGTRAALNQ